MVSSTKIFTGSREPVWTVLRNKAVRIRKRAEHLELIADRAEQTMEVGETVEEALWELAWDATRH